MASRAQQHLIILNLIVSPRDTDLCAEIENVDHISFEDIGPIYEKSSDLSGTIVYPKYPGMSSPSRNLVSSGPDNGISPNFWHLGGKGTNYGDTLKYIFGSEVLLLFL